MGGGGRNLGRGCGRGWLEQGDAGTGGGRGMRGRYGIEGGCSRVVRGGRGSEGEGRRGKGRKWVALSAQNAS